MPRSSRGPEMPPQQQQQQRQSPRAPLHLRTTNSETNGAHAHHRSSPKLEDNHRRSPRSPLLEYPSCNQKKRGSRVTDLETKLGHVQGELKKLREQLATAEAAKRDAQHELEETKKLIPTIPAAAGEQPEEEHHSSAEIQQKNTQQGKDDDELPAESSLTEEGEIQVDSLEVMSPVAAPVDVVLEKEDMDAVLLEKEDNGDDAVVVEEMVKKNEGSEDHVAEEVVINEEESKEEEGEEAPAVAEAEEEPKEPHGKVQMSELEAKLEEKVKELERCLAENLSLKKLLAEAEADAAAARTREEEATLKLTHVAEALAESMAKANQLGEQLESAEGAKSSLETDMKKLKIQTDQWRKAADAAVAELSATGGMEAYGRGVAERCGSMDKHLGVGYGGGGYAGLGSPLVAEDWDEGLGGGKRKGAGIRVFGDLWKKKAQHK